MFITLLKNLLKAAGILIALLVALVAIVAGYLVISHDQRLLLPSPTGPASVGRGEYDWTDANRADPLSEKADLKREFDIWIWYPTDATPAKTPAPYLPPPWAQAYENDQGAGKFIETNPSQIQTHSLGGTALAKTQASYPVLLLLPGLGPSVPDYTVFAENLASHGYVVVGINEAGSSNIVVFPDGRVVPRSEKGTVPDSADPATENADANFIGSVWASDAVFVLNQLQMLDAAPSSPFYSALDLSRVGVFGHSLGGATAIEVCQKDSRCKAGADLDGTSLSDTLPYPINQPFLFLSEQLDGPFPQGCVSNRNCMPIYASYQQVNTDAYFIFIDGAKHFNFTDRPLRSSPLGRILLSKIGAAGSIDPARALEISNAYLVTFFDRYLKNTNSPLLGGSPSTPEVHFNKK